MASTDPDRRPADEQAQPLVEPVVDPTVEHPDALDDLTRESLDTGDLGDGGAHGGVVPADVDVPALGEDSREVATEPADTESAPAPSGADLAGEAGDAATDEAAAAYASDAPPAMDSPADAPGLEVDATVPVPAAGEPEDGPFDEADHGPSGEVDRGAAERELEAPSDGDAAAAVDDDLEEDLPRDVEDGRRDDEGATAPDADERTGPGMPPEHDGSSEEGVAPAAERPAEPAAAVAAAVSGGSGDRVTRPVSGAAAWRRLALMAKPRPSKANFLGALLALLLGAAFVTQVQLTQERGLSELSQPELIRVLDDVSVRNSRLDAQIQELEDTRDRLQSGAGTSAEALAQARKRADTLAILAGTVGVSGPGIVVSIDDPNGNVRGPVILDLIQELRDAGAESIDVGGVRVVASSFVGQRDDEILIDGVPVERPIVITAIGDPKTLSSAMNIPGGIVETVRQKDGSADVMEAEELQITSLHPPDEMTYATPVE